VSADTPSRSVLFRARNHLAVVMPFVLILAVLAGLSLWELRFQDGGRVFLIGEDQLASAEKRATVCLLSYSSSHLNEDLQCFRQEIDVAMGDMQARRELDSSRRSISVISDGLVRGRNRPQDVPTAILFYKLAPWLPEIEKAVQTWRDSDQYVLQLGVISEQLESGKDPAEAARLNRKILQIDSELSGLERNFAIHLNYGMHFLAMCLCVAEGIAALFLTVLTLIVYHRVMTVREAAQRRAQFLAYYDTLTGLPNRTLLNERLDTAISEAHASGRKVAVIFLDLDRFKIINDSLGHSAGDALLCEVAQRLRENLRDHDTVARVGGDEFLIVLADLEDESIARSASERILGAITDNFTAKGALLNITSSIGISVFPEHGHDSETLIKNADAAMYCAKEGGRNRVRLFADEMNVNALERLTMENSLRLAIEREELYLEYQPQFDIASGRITGLEALLRWRHPENGVVSPGKFIPVAENSGLILPIGEWVLTTACRQSRVWQDQGLLAVPIAVNVSAVQFRQEGFCDKIRDALRTARLPPEFLELELTESLLLSNEDVVSEVIEELKGMGVRLSIDDFGTGYSSLSYLRRLPVSKLKIDQSFVRDLAFSTDDAAITIAIINMAKNLNLKVIAEGVETEAQLEFLRAHRCDELQGYFFSRPLPPAELLTRLPELNIWSVGREFALSLQ
jgi:diguanylate cyclase (GGDEF)-like protein